MKELSVEQKAKAYDKAIEKAKAYHNDYTNDIMEEIFPELKESEDEKIRKGIIYGLNYLERELSWDFLDNVDILDAYAWLEKQVEQKPAELAKGKDYGIDGLWHAQRILEKTLGKVDGYQTDDGILSHECAISAVKELYEQKPAWSEEDKEVVEALNNYVKNLDIFFSEIKIGDKDILSKEFREKVQHWLKSLKDRYTWKPSDEQMGVIEAVINNRSFQRRHLDLLYEQLKKLREE